MSRVVHHYHPPVGGQQVSLCGRRTLDESAEPAAYPPDFEIPWCKECSRLLTVCLLCGKAPEDPDQVTFTASGRPMCGPCNQDLDRTMREGERRRRERAARFTVHLEVSDDQYQAMVADLVHEQWTINPKDRRSTVHAWVRLSTEVGR